MGSFCVYLCGEKNTLITPCNSVSTWSEPSLYAQLGRCHVACGTIAQAVGPRFVQWDRGAIWETSRNLDFGALRERSLCVYGLLLCLSLIVFSRIRFTIFIFLSSPDFPTVKHTWVTPYALPAVARAFFLAAAYSWPLAAPGLNFLRFSRALEKKTIRLLKCLVNRLLRRSVRVFSVFTLSSRAEARGAGGPKLHAALARRILPTLGQCDSLSCSAILQGVMCIFSLWGLKRGMRLV